MVIPFFSEFGKYANELFSRGFPLGIIQFSSTIKTCKLGDVTLSTALKPPEMSMHNGKLNFTYRAPPEYGTTISPGVDQDGKVSLRVSQELCRFVQGLKWNGEGILNTQEKEFYFNTAATYQHKWLSATAGFDSSKENPAVTGSLSSGYKGFIFGGSLTYPTDEGSEVGYSAGVGYCLRDAQVHLIWNKQQYDEVKAYFYQRLSDRLEAGIWVNWRPGNAPGEDTDAGSVAGSFAAGEAPHLPLKPYSETGNIIAIAASYLISPYTALKGKLNTDSEVTVAVETRIRPGTTLTLCGQIDGKEISGGKHMIGLGFEITA